MNLDTLNDPQREAVMHGQGPLLVLAGAGSGKTRVITTRIARLINEQGAADRILAVTFTNKAANEMRHRIEQMIGPEAHRIWCGTFHGICARILRRYGQSIGLSQRFVVYDDSDQVSLLAQILRDFQLAEKHFPPKDIRHRIDRAKNEGVTAKQYQGGDYFTDVVAEVYPEYQRRLAAANAVDFGDLLLRTIELIDLDCDVREALCGHFQHLLVDEFQDTNLVQYQFIRLLSERHHNLCVVGDDDQSIYSWRGADIRNILDFEKDHPSAKVIKLEQNYRSTQTVLDAATAIISRNSGRKPKALWTDRGQGMPLAYRLCPDERAEAQWVIGQISRLRQQEGLRFGDIAIFYRTHAQSRILEEAMRSARPQIPYSIFGGVRFYDRAEVRDLLAYLRVLINPNDDVSFQRILNVPPRGIGTTTLGHITAYAQRHKVALAEAASALIAAEEGPLRRGTKQKIDAFLQLLTALRRRLEADAPDRIAEEVLERTGYLEHLAVDESIEARSREENLMELMGTLRDHCQRFPDQATVEGFLEHVTLSSDIDAFRESEGAVTMMTVHSAKGLEFPAVFLVGLEQGIFPHARSLNDPDQLEEERRLAYVATTRAKSALFLSHVQKRWIFGQQQVNPASEYLFAIPPHLFGGNAPAVIHFTPRAQPHFAQRASRDPGEVWVDRSESQLPPDDEVLTEGAYTIGMKVRHPKFGVGEVRTIQGATGPVNLTIFFRSVGPKTIRADFVEPAH